jgi:serine/threonine-protein kinase
LYSGAQFGPYELLEPIGQGGMGEVYKGYQPALNRTVAIKILPPLLADADESFRKRFEREAQTVAGLRHPNIVNVFDFGQLDGAYFMVMEYINGQDLAGYVREHGRLPLAEAQAIIADLGAALDYAHDHNVIHRDVKPSNVMLEQTAQGWRSRVVLMDFGIARVTTNGGTALTQTGAVGTLDYIAPEQILAARTVDRAADIYSLGIVAYKLLTGELPFKADNPASLLFAHLQKPAPDPRDVVDDLPESVARAVLKALAKQPEDRFPSASAFAAALRG